MIGGCGRSLAALLVPVVLLGACTPTMAPVQLLPAPGEGRPVERQVMAMVPLADGATLEAVRDDLVAALPVQVIALWPMDQVDLYCLVFAVDAGHDVADVLAALEADPRVEIAQRMRIFETLASRPDDPLLDLQTGLISADVLGAQTMATGNGVRVAVVDSGIDHRHPDLERRIGARRNLLVDGRADASERHGTAVAGVIAAEANNRTGIVGVAPDAELLAMRACAEPAGATAARCTSFTLARALNASLAADASVINLSLAGPEDPTMARFVARALAQGRVVVAAAGPEPGAFPAALPGVVAVAVAGGAGEVSATAGVVGPGEGVVTTAPGGGYAVYDGASLAAAHVSGIVALMLEVAPDLGPGEVLRRLSDGGRLEAEAGGTDRLDACRLVRELAPPERAGLCGTS